MAGRPESTFPKQHLGSGVWGLGFGGGLGCRVLETYIYDRRQRCHTLMVFLNIILIPERCDTWGGEGLHVGFDIGLGVRCLLLRIADFVFRAYDWGLGV